MVLEEEKIRKTLQYFIDGLDRVDGDLVRKAFYKNARLYYNTKQGFMDVSAEEFCNSFERIRNTPEHPFNKEKCKKEITYINISGDAASAKVEWIFSRFKYNDYYNLLKINEDWYIMNKVFSTEFF